MLGTTVGAILVAIGQLWWLWGIGILLYAIGDIALDEYYSSEVSSCIALALATILGALFIISVFVNAVVAIVKAVN